MIKLIPNDATELANLRELGKRPELRIVPVVMEAKHVVAGWTAIAMPPLLRLDRMFKPSQSDFENVTAQLMMVCVCIIILVTLFR